MISSWAPGAGRKPKLAAALALAGALLAPPVSPAQEMPVQSHTLTNGMKILVCEDHSIPSVALYIFYRIGSRNERAGATGISHFFEHMMFNGARKYGPKEFDRVMEAAGGSNNAYTGTDVTVYQDWFPPSALERILDLEGDRIADLSFDPKVVESERGVIISERRTSVDASHSGTLDEQLRAAAFTAHPYHWPVLGWMSDIEQWQVADLRRHFSMGYSPANATMVVCGDVTLAAVLAAAKKQIEPIPARELPPPVTTVEPEQMGERRLKVERFAQLPMVMAAFHVPSCKHADFPALCLLEDILLRGQSSRLYQRLVDKDQLAIAVEGGFEIAMDPTLFVITVQPKDGVDTAKIEKALYEELGRIGQEPVSGRELEKARNCRLMDHCQQLKTINGMAHELGRYEVFFGDYRRLFEAPRQLAAVTAQDVKRVAAACFRERNRTVGLLVPTPEGEEKRHE